MKRFWVIRGSVNRVYLPEENPFNGWAWAYRGRVPKRALTFTSAEKAFRHFYRVGLSKSMARVYRVTVTTPDDRRCGCGHICCHCQTYPRTRAA